MRILRLYSALFLLLLAAKGNAQVVDTTKSINAWKLMHNYSRFEDTDLDTTTFDLHIDFNPLYRNGMAYENLGILGHAAQNLYFFDRPSSDYFLFGSSREPYMANPDRTIFYNTRKPFTEIVFSNIPGVEWHEESIRFLHTQNMDPFSNIGIDLEILSGKELYYNEESKVTKFTLFGSRAKEKYSAFGTFHFNRFNNKENGGIENPQGFRNDSLTDIWSYDVNLGNASSNYTNLKLFYTQKFSITEKRFYTDTLGVTTDSGRNFSFNHQIELERNQRKYRDEFSDLNEFYSNFYYHHNDIIDSVVQDRITNTFQFILGDPYTDKLSARVYAGHEFARYGQRSPGTTYRTFSHYEILSTDPPFQYPVYKDTSVTVFNNKYSNELFAGFHMAGPPENKWYWNIDGKYYLAGYYRNNFEVNATFSREVFTKYRLGLRANMENRNVNYYYQHYSSAFFKWDNDFSAAQIMKGEVFLANKESRFNAVFSAGLLTNYNYWDENALPAQYDQAILLMSAKVYKHFKVSNFNSRNQLLLQYTTADEVLRLPLLVFKSSDFWEQSLFKGALIAQVGVDFYISSSFVGNSYMPATGIFYLQNSETIGAYPFTDVFLNFRIKRTRLFGSYCNAWSFINSNYFTAADYPSKPGYFRIGIAWTFYD